MNGQTNTGGPALPQETLRDRFAMAAMVALMSSEPWVRAMNSHAAEEDVQFKQALARHSWSMADTMLATRGEGGEP
jgi:hypothetical protein